MHKTLFHLKYAIFNFIAIIFAYAKNPCFLKAFADIFKLKNLLCFRLTLANYLSKKADIPLYYECNNTEWFKHISKFDI